MVIRSVFKGVPRYPFYEHCDVSCCYFAGSELSQKRKCELSLHMNYNAEYPDIKVLEVSSASLNSLGAKLSAMHLSKRTKKGVTSVESVYQSSRIYSDGTRTVGPFPEYTFLPGKECKKLVKQASLGMNSFQYSFDGMTFYAPDHHVSLFYDYLYLNALLEPENEAVKEELLSGDYMAFTDLASLSLNTQARSAAIFRGLVMAGLIDEVTDYRTYLSLFRTGIDGRAVGPESYEHSPIFHQDHMISLLPTVPCSVNEDGVEAYYSEHCWILTDRKDNDNFLDLKCE